MEAGVVSGSRSQGPGIPELLVVVVISKTLVTSVTKRMYSGKEKGLVQHREPGAHSLVADGGCLWQGDRKSGRVSGKGSEGRSTMELMCFQEPSSSHRLPGLTGFLKVPAHLYHSPGDTHARRVW